MTAIPTTQVITSDAVKPTMPAVVDKTLPRTFKMLVHNYRGDEDTPRSAQFAEFVCHGPPKCMLAIHRTHHTEFTLGAYYDAQFGEAITTLTPPIKFPAFVFKCVHIDFTAKAGEHAHLVADPGVVNSQLATADFWNVKRGTFTKEGFYPMVIEFGARTPDVDIALALRNGDDLLVKLQDMNRLPVALPPDRFLTTTTVRM